MNIIVDCSHVIVITCGAKHSSMCDLLHIIVNIKFLFFTFTSTQF